MRRTFKVALLACAATMSFSALPSAAQTAATGASARGALYAGAGPELGIYSIDAEQATLTRQGAVTLPGTVQYGWPHPNRRHFYVAWSNGPRDMPNGVSAFDVDTNGGLKLRGQPIAIKARPIHVTTDNDGTHVLVAFNEPSSFTIHEIKPDGSLGNEVKQSGTFDFGVYAHQIRVSPANNVAMLVTRGNIAEADKAEDPGALKLFSYTKGLLKPLASIAPGGGKGFQPRHLDFHPSGKWVYVSLEPQSVLMMFEQKPDGSLGANPAFTKDSLPRPKETRPDHGQRSGTVHVHPNGRIVYQADRSTPVLDANGRLKLGLGTNAIGVFEINQQTGEPTLVQNADTHGFVPRTFALDPSARLIVVGNQIRMAIREGEQLVPTLPNLSVLRVRPDGKLDFVRKYDLNLPDRTSLSWMGINPLP